MILDILRNFTPMMVMLALALGSGWLARKLDPEADQGPEKASHTADFFMEDFITNHMDETGRRDRRLEAKNLVHYPDTNSNELSEPYVVLYPKAGRPWEVRSERGWSSKDSDVMLLLGKVHIWRDEADGRRVMDIETREVRITPQAEYGETDEEATIRTPSTESRGRGLRANIQEGRVELLSQVSTVYERKAR